MGYKPYAKYHLYETEHSGFYGGELSAEKVNLLPKTWTKFTVTDGDWKTKNTLEPLWNRDIFLANEIDKIDYDKQNHYIASSHFVIDHENRTMYINPFEHLYTFTNGIIFESENNYISTDLPNNGGLLNKLYLDEGKLNYKSRKLTSAEQSASIWDPNQSAISSKPQFNVNLNISSGSIDIMNNAGLIIVNTNSLTYEDEVYKGMWLDSYLDYWDSASQTRYTGPAEGWNYKEEHPDMWQNSAYYDEISSKNWSYYSAETLDYFNPLDNTETDSANYKAGSHFISGNIDMLPSNVLYIW